MLLYKKLSSAYLGCKMSDILTEDNAGIYTITFNKPNKHNAFDDKFIHDLLGIIQTASNELNVKAIIFKANGKNFSAGADLSWMQRMAKYSYAENTADALELAKLIHAIYTCPKPTIAMVQGATYGGGLGIIAACDVAIAADDAKFCFSEVKLGLIPAVISPYVVAAIGARAANALFISAELFDAPKALSLNFIQHMLPAAELAEFTANYVRKITKYPVDAVANAKSLVKTIQDMPIGDSSQQITAELIAKQRAADSAQTALANFFKKNFE